MGICGGFQMLGIQVEDPDGLEGEVGITDGLGLLEMTTRMIEGKQLKNVTGELSASLPLPENAVNTARLSGYEMHNGVTTGAALDRPLARLDGRPDGAISDDDQVIGSYVHRIFDEPSACEALLAWAGLRGEQKAIDYQQHRLQQLDRLADQVEQHLDTDWLKTLLDVKQTGTAR